MAEKDLHKMFSSIGNFVIKKNHCKAFIAKIILERNTVSQILYIKY